MGEFDFIAQHFRPLAGKGSFALRNDGAILSIPLGQELVISSDTMVENVHFLPDDPASSVGQKLLRCNLSDIAAMGAKPYGYTMNVSIPSQGHYGETWFSGFSHGLATDQHAYGLHLLGGDTTGTSGPLVLSLTIFGTVAHGQALRRDQGRPGESVWVTGNLGQAALGLAVRKGHITDPTGAFVQAYRYPTPRTGLSLYGIISAVMDISDGLLQDAGHLAEESSVAITLYEDLLPFSDAAQTSGPEWRETCLLGGDDYELLMTCPKEHEEILKEECARKHVPVTRIGYVSEGRGVSLVGKNGQPLHFSRTGWQHF